MSTHASNFPRWPGPVSVAVGAGLMTGPAVLLILAALHTPVVLPLGAASIEAIPGRAAAIARPSGCSGLALPSDASIGNAGGDPYAFYEFNREETLAAMRQDAERCMRSEAAVLP